MLFLVLHGLDLACLTWGSDPDTQFLSLSLGLQPYCIQSFLVAEALISLKAEFMPSFHPYSHSHVHALQKSLCHCLPSCRSLVLFSPSLQVTLATDW